MIKTKANTFSPAVCEKRKIELCAFDIRWTIEDTYNKLDLSEEAYREESYHERSSVEDRTILSKTSIPPLKGRQEDKNSHECGSRYIVRPIIDENTDRRQIVCKAESVSVRRKNRE